MSPKDISFSRHASPSGWSIYLLRRKKQNPSSGTYLRNSPSSHRNRALPLPGGGIGDRLSKLFRISSEPACALRRGRPRLPSWQDFSC